MKNFIFATLSALGVLSNGVLIQQEGPIIPANAIDNTGDVIGLFNPGTVNQGIKGVINNSPVNNEAIPN